MNALYEKVMTEIPEKKIKEIAVDTLLAIVQKQAEDNILSAHNAGHNSAYILAFSDVAEIEGIKIKPFYNIIMDQLRRTLAPFRIEEETFANIITVKVSWPTI